MQIEHVLNCFKWYVQFVSPQEKFFWVLGRTFAKAQDCSITMKSLVSIAL